LCGSISVFTFSFQFIIHNQQSKQWKEKGVKLDGEEDDSNKKAYYDNESIILHSIII
jgi:hypothetical protein